mgnify:CR=1 FL=1
MINVKIDNEILNSILSIEKNKQHVSKLVEVKHQENPFLIRLQERAPQLKWASKSPIVTDPEQ